MLCGKMAVATWGIPTASAILFGVGFLIGVFFYGTTWVATVPVMFSRLFSLHYCLVCAFRLH